MRTARAAVVMLTTVAGAAVQGAAAPGLGLASTAQVVALWHMDDSGATMVDSSGGGHHGSIHNVRVRQPGWRGYSFRFATTPAYVAVPSAPALNPGNSTFTVRSHVRFFRRPPASVGDYDLVRKGWSTTPGGSWKVEIETSGAASCMFHGSAGSVEVIGTRSLADGAWHAVQCRRTTTAVTLTVDGVSRTVYARTGTIANGSRLYVGAKSSHGGDQFAGYLDEIKLIRG
jgi:hypothetical protein